MNAVTGQNLSVVSDVKGTTTDPVYKTMELLPLGPVMVIDTPGIDDEGELGRLRVTKSRQVLNKTDIAILVVDGSVGMQKEDTEMQELFEKKQIPYLIVFNKADLVSGPHKDAACDLTAENTESDSAVCAGKNHEGNNSATFSGIQNHQSAASVMVTAAAHSTEVKYVVHVSARTGEGIEELKNRIGALRPTEEERDLLEGLVNPGDVVILVTPIDKAAPKGRLILPQQQTIRALLDHGCMTMVVRDTELADALSKLPQAPDLVITDSQAFGKVSKIVPEGIPMTSFSILFARYKGDLKQAVAGVSMLDSLQDGDKVLISEGCTHHRQCNDIGTVKLPGWIRDYVKKDIEFCFTSGTEFPEDLSPYKLIVHCGGCMLNEREMKYRLAWAKDQNIAMTNYGILIAHVHGILKRSVLPFPAIAKLLD